MVKFRVFIAAPFRSKINQATGLVKEDFKNFLSNLDNFLEKRGHETHLALKRENWGRDKWSDEDCTRTDYEKIKNSDVLLAYIDDSPTTGVYIELGWASSLGKKIIIVTQNKRTCAPLINGLQSLFGAEILEFAGQEDLLSKLLDHFETMERI